MKNNTHNHIVYVTYGKTFTEYTCMEPGCNHARLTLRMNMSPKEWVDKLNEFRKVHPFKDEDLQEVPF